MGLFLDVVSVLAPPAKVQAVLEDLEWDELASCTFDREDRALVLFHEPEGDDARGRTLSEKLGCPAFFLHIHDDDLWMYMFFVAGELRDQFNTIPDYWDEDQDPAPWRGNADLIAREWRDVTAESIQRYLVHADLDDDHPGKAYPDDKFEADDTWQIVDFLRKLGTPYPDEMI